MTTELPIKNKSGYLHYCSDVRETIKKNEPEIKSVDIIKKMGQGWKSLSPEEVKKYETRAAADKERFLREKQEWTLQNPNAVIEKKTKAKRTKKQVETPEEIVIMDDELVQESAPVVVEPAPEPVVEAVPDSAALDKKKKPNKFQNFCKKQRPILKSQKPNLQPKEVLSELSVLWKALSQNEQDSFTE